MHDFVITSLIAIIACLFCIWLLCPLAARIGLVDRPNERKLHKKHVPLIGGIAIFFGFCFSLLHLHASLMPYRSLLAGSALLVLMGVVDDFKDLSAKLRLCGQLMVGLTLTSWGGIVLSDLGNLFFMGNLALGLWALPITILCVVAYINALNMMDGQDGLAGSVSLGQFIWLLIYACQLHLFALEHLLVIMSVLMLVFLSFNMSFPWRREASIFLGDSGSTFLAFILIWVAIHVSQQSVSIVHPVAILWVMALPIFDLFNVIIHRWHQKKSIFKPGRDHCHHVLHFYGVNKTLSTLLLSLFSFGLGAIGYCLNAYRVSEGMTFILFLGVMMLYLFAANIARHSIKVKQYADS